MKQTNSALETLLVSLVDETSPLRAALVYRLSKPSLEDMVSLKSIWPTIPVERRQKLMSRLIETEESNFEVDFSQVALLALQDDNANVRQLAIELLGVEETPELIQKFITLLQTDPDEGVRATAATALGEYVLLGELENLDCTTAKEAEEALLGACYRETCEVRRRALESIAFSSRPEVTTLIEKVAQEKDLKSQASALFAMGRNGDSRWIPYIQKALHSPECELQFEATRAAGEINLSSAVPMLIQLTRSDDQEVKEMAIWSLGEIGGAEAQEALFYLADRETDAGLSESIEDAINMAALSMGDIGMFMAAPEDEDDFEDFDKEQDIH